MFAIVVCVFMFDVCNFCSCVFLFDVFDCSSCVCDFSRCLCIFAMTITVFVQTTLQPHNDAWFTIQLSNLHKTIHNFTTRNHTTTT